MKRNQKNRRTFEVLELKEAAVDLGMPHGMTRLLVREEFILLKKAIEVNRRLGKGGMMITGQPGIGALSFRCIRRF